MISSAAYLQLYGIYDNNYQGINFTYDFVYLDGGHSYDTVKHDYDKIQEDDAFNFIDLNEFSPSKKLTIEIVHADGKKETILANHSYNSQQIEWFKEGSALNLIKKQNKN